jgi:glutamate dehydrogenase/leucine dehydrogenase
MAADVSVDEVYRLARAMTFKNAAAGLPHGGGKAGIIADPRSPNKEALVRSFAQAIRDLVEYIPGPDMGTDETCMGWVLDEIGRAVGLPKVIGGIPLDELGATGYGLASCAEVAAPSCGLDLKGARIAIEGYGNVGRHAARFLEEKGAILVAASDSKGAFSAPDGVPVDDVDLAKAETGKVESCGGTMPIKQQELITVPCDILIPAARPDTIHEGNVDDIQAKLVLPGANIPATAKAESRLHERGILMVPDFIANAGGVICAAVEYRGSSQTAAFNEIHEKITKNSEEVVDRSREEQREPRAVAMDLAKERVLRAMKLKRNFGK